MQLSIHTDYALRTLIHLALQGNDRPVTVQEIARDYGVSANHVAKVAQTLSHLNYVHSLRGRSGGLVLARPPAAINTGSLVRETENLKLLECFAPDAPCPIDPVCRLKNALYEAREAFLAVLDGYSLEDLVGNGGELEELLFKRS